MQATEEEAGTRVAYFTANQLYGMGRGTLLAGYVIGLLDADHASVRNSNYCVPSGATGEQARDVVWRYLEQNPQERHMGGAFVTRRALLSAWPCPTR
jgi:hypothetical protein